MGFIEHLNVIMRSNHSLINVVTYEETRFINMLAESPLFKDKNIIQWDLAKGFKAIQGDTAHLKKLDRPDPISCLSEIEKSKIGTIFILRDFHHHYRESIVVRALRNLSYELQFTKKCIIMTTPSASLPMELREDVLQLELPLPTYEEIEKQLESMSKWDNDISDTDIDKDIVKFKQLARKFNKVVEAQLKAIPISYKRTLIRDFDKYGSGSPLEKITLLDDKFNKKEEVKLTKEISKPSEYTAYLKDFIEVYKESNSKSKDFLKKVNEISDKMVKHIDKVDLDGDKLKLFKKVVTTFQGYLSCFDNIFARMVKLQNSHAYLLMGAGKKLVSALKNKD